MRSGSTQVPKQFFHGQLVLFQGIFEDHVGLLIAKFDMAR